MLGLLGTYPHVPRPHPQRPPGSHPLQHPITRSAPFRSVLPPFLAPWCCQLPHPLSLKLVPQCLSPHLPHMVSLLMPHSALASCLPKLGQPAPPHDFPSPHPPVCQHSPGTGWVGGGACLPSFGSISVLWLMLCPSLPGPALPAHLKAMLPLKPFCMSDLLTCFFPQLS